MDNKSKFTQSNSTPPKDFYQLKLPLELDVLIPEDDSVRLLLDITQRMDLSELIQSYSHIEKSKASPRQLFAIVLYAFMNGIFSFRGMEKACRRDINFLFLLQGKPAPDHTTFHRFCTRHMRPVMDNLFSQLCQILADEGELSLENLFIDGTKIEANANKYTFVWKKSILKYRTKMMDKISLLFARADKNFNIQISYKERIQMRHMKQLRRKLKAIQKAEGIQFSHGRGSRKKPLQKILEELDGYIRRLKEYTKSLYICGRRNSYSKTDHDATFMRMKEDAMKNGQLKAGYNIQYGVDAEYIVGVTVGPETTDTTTLIPFLKKMEEQFSMHYKNITADAGYESEENYSHLEENQYESYIKPSNYEQSKKRKYKKDIGRRENMDYDEERDEYTCANERKIRSVGTRIRKSRTGYRAEITRYKCENCAGCQLKSQCIHGNHSKKPLEERTKCFEVAKRFQQQRRENRKRIESRQGKELRMNRSIQAEGAFAEIKENMGFRRFLGRGTENVFMASTLLAMAYNINTWDRKKKRRSSGQYLYKLKEIA